MASTGFLQVSSRAAGQVVHEAEEFRFGPDGVGEKAVVRQGPVLEYGSRVLPDRGQRAVGDHAGEVLCAVQVVWRISFAVPIDVMGDRILVFVPVLHPWKGVVAFTGDDRVAEPALGNLYGIAVIRVRQGIEVAGDDGFAGMEFRVLSEVGIAQRGVQRVEQCGVVHRGPFTGFPFPAGCRCCRIF